MTAHPQDLRINRYILAAPYPWFPSLAPNRRRVRAKILIRIKARVPGSVFRSRSMLFQPVVATLSRMVAALVRDLMNENE
jgi:hypothetical protein